MWNCTKLFRLPSLEKPGVFHNRPTKKRTQNQTNKKKNIWIVAHDIGAAIFRSIMIVAQVATTDWTRWGWKHTHTHKHSTRHRICSMVSCNWPMAMRKCLKLIPHTRRTHFNQINLIRIVNIFCHFTPFSVHFVCLFPIFIWQMRRRTNAPHTKHFRLGCTDLPNTFSSQQFTIRNVFVFWPQCVCVYTQRVQFILRFANVRWEFGHREKFCDNFETNQREKNADKRKMLGTNNKWKSNGHYARITEKYWYNWGIKILCFF